MLENYQLSAKPTCHYAIVDPTLQGCSGGPGPARWGGGGEEGAKSIQRPHALFRLPKPAPTKGPGNPPHAQVHTNYNSSKHPLSF